MLAVHFGAGNIGRGFVGQLLHEAGYDIVFLDVQEEVVDALKRDGRYEVVLAGEEGRRIPVDRVTALHSVDDADEARERLAGADLVTTAVGPSVLPIVAPAIAAGLAERSGRGGGPINVIACENMVGGSQALKEHTMEHVPEELKEAVEDIAAFPNAAVDRIVPEQTIGGVDVLVEPFYEWVVDASQVKGQRPEIPGITYVEALRPYIERKLLTVNTGHSATAYLGYARGIATIHASLEDDHVRETASGALQETSLLLSFEHGFDPGELGAYREKVIARFENPGISDETTRVARAPIRKLGREERFVSPAVRLLEMGHEPAYLAEVIRTVLDFDYPQDAEAVELQETVRAGGKRAALAQYAGIAEDHPLVDLVLDAGR